MSGYREKIFKIGLSKAEREDLKNRVTADANAYTDSNAVLITGDQNISGTKTFNNPIRFTGSSIGYYSSSSELQLKLNQNGVGVYLSASRLYPNTNNTLSLGYTGYYWKNLYLSGQLVDGTNAIYIKDIVTKYNINMYINGYVNDDFVKQYIDKDYIQSNIPQEFIQNNISQTFIQGYINKEYIQNYINKDYIQGYINKDYIQNYVDKEYVQGYIPREYLINAIGVATTQVEGLMSPTDKKKLSTLVAILGEDNNNAIVDTLNEVFKIFENYPQGANILELISNKVDKTELNDIAKTNIDNNFSVTQTISGVDDTPLNLKANHDSWANIALFNKTGARLGNIGALGYKPYWWGGQGDTGQIALVKDVPTSTTQLTNDSGFLTEHQQIKTINGETLVGEGDITLDSKISSESLTTVAVGGIKKGESLKGKSVVEVLENIFFPYVAFSMGNMSSNPSASTVYEKGTTKTLNSITQAITLGSKALTSLKLYKGSTLIQEKTSSISTSNTFSNLAQNLTATTTFKVDATDGVTTLSKTLNVFTFVDPYFYGILSTNATPTSGDITNKTKSVTSKGNKTYTYTCTAQFPFIAYPASYGDLKSILDGNGFENLTDFTKHTVTLTITSGSVSYNIYIKNSAATISNFAYTFKY